MNRSKCMQMTIVVALFGAFSPKPNAALADGRKDGMREDRSATRVPSSPGTTEFETQPVETISISLSDLLQARGVETSDDVGRFLNSLFPPSFTLFSGGIVVTESEFTLQYTAPSTRPGLAHPIPNPDATADDGPLTDVVEFSGWAADYLVSGRFFLAGRELIVDIEWTRNDGTIVLAESFARTIRVTPWNGTSVASGIDPILAPSWKCKCSHDSGACSPQQCNDRKKCYTGGASCGYVWQ